MEFAGDFETHITLGVTVADIEALVPWVERHGLKIHHIVLDRGLTRWQPMVSRRGRGQLSQELSAATELKQQLEAAGFAVTRIKIEAAPENEDVPVSNAQATHGGRYFEHHVKLALNMSANQAAITAVAVQHAAHLSHNARHVRTDGLQERFVTQRCYAVGRDTARARLEALLAELRPLGHPVITVEEEFVVYDSNPDVDRGWLTVINLPRTYYPAPHGDDHPRVPVFDPALKHYTNAFRPGDPVFANPDDGRRWVAARRLATDHVLRAIAESPLGEQLILRGSRLLKAWVDDAAREPGDLDWVIAPSEVETYARNGARQVQRLVQEAVFARPAPAGIELLDRDVTTDEIWTYERVPGRRIVIPWRVARLPGGAVQVDVVLGEPIAEPDQQASIALADGAAVLVRAATPAQSLAWKLVWLTTDIYPQGKDLYDAVLLAERTALSSDVLAETFQVAGEGPLPPTASALVADWRTDWSNFLVEYPWVEGSEAEWLARLTKALEPTFGRC